ncbi:hypothetical protein SPRG_20483 [Saprolegnia parasitica CBS 223.65]|uniref:Peptidase C1A papain C-terminal domain-containing protein n=1 Tax=Saprolegnia parasitica (strain CBS 223.65) TaxID=695850 RepID=A0A067CC14_SAPPC|nr:hypothetical protein SPRG_20483 [Saprolegnia parasitica CBS 223.65]KDO26680.1 hypothetical protein SPRG_20483 [Saprolegnia parasitica CBS 223.65]|eukprot:XP_012202577.1 hypothetical protein SPRG_20483 [Saprolegnia parasitica CBS 223.65]
MQRILLATAALTLVAADRDALVAELNQWNKAFGPSYLPTGVDAANTEDLLVRLQAAKDAIAAVSKEQPTATFGIGPFSLYSAKEFQNYLRRSFAPGAALLQDAPRVEDRGVGGANGTLDWSATSCMNPVKDQGKCSSAWVFSTTASVEAAHCIVTGSLLNVSEQDVVSCDRDQLDEGCRGGLEFTAMDWIGKNGICLAKDYPYTSGSDGTNGVCQTTCKKQMLAVEGHAWATGELKLETALLKQPITAAVIAANDAWQHYTSGVVTSCPGNTLDHSVLVVGYGAENGVDYFKVRSSWGAAWGDKGYIKLQRGVGGKGMCNVAEFPIYPKLKGTPMPTTAPVPTKPAC